jgi:hypothetical protein
VNFDPRDLPRTIAEGEKAVASLPTTRTCQGCDLCCTAVGVEAINKPAGVPCPHLSGLPGWSCSIYRTRPVNCASFVCLWRGSNTALPQEAFPAKAGFVVAIPTIQIPMLITIHPDPRRPDAWRAWTSTFSQLAADANAIVVVGQAHLASTIFAPSGKVFTKADRPDLFKDGGKTIGVPQDEFGPELSLPETVRRIWRLFDPPAPKVANLRSRLMR